MILDGDAWAWDFDAEAKSEDVAFEIFDVERDFHLVKDRGQIMAISGAERVYSKDVTPASIELSSETATEIANGSLRGLPFKFRPFVWDDPTTLVPARYDTVAATILRNLAFAPEAERIDSMLRHQIQLGLEGLVEFVEAKMEPYNQAIEAGVPAPNK